MHSRMILNNMMTQQLTSQDIVQEIWRYVQVSTNVQVSMCHAQRFICYQMNKIQTLQTELDHYKKLEERRLAQEREAQQRIVIRGKITEILAPMCKKWKFSSNKASVFA